MMCVVLGGEGSVVLCSVMWCCDVGWGDKSHPTPGNGIRRTKEAATQAVCAGNTRGYHSEYGNSWFNNRENDDA